ncbi:MAG: hypothetical protein AAGC55_14160, partial [Myxococcota bacterium]
MWQNRTMATSAHRPSLSRTTIAQPKLPRIAALALVLVTALGCNRIPQVESCPDGTVCAPEYECVHNMHQDRWYCAAPGKIECGDGEPDLIFDEQCDGDLDQFDTYCIDRGYDYGHMSCALNCSLAEDDCHDFNWSAQPTPADTGSLRHLWGSAPDDLFAVSIDGGVIRYDGQAWSRDILFDQAIGANPDDPDSPIGLWDISGNSSNEVLAVGDAGTVMHRTGQGTWRNEYSIPAQSCHPISSTTMKTVLLGAWLSDTDDNAERGEAYAVGLMTSLDIESILVETIDSAIDLQPALLACRWRAVLLHYDGEQWTRLEPRDVLPNLGDPDDPADLDNVQWLIDIWGSGPNNLFLIGGSVTLQDINDVQISRQVWHYDGDRWTEIHNVTIPFDFAAPEPSLGILTSIWGHGDTAHAVGVDEIWLLCTRSGCEVGADDLDGAPDTRAGLLDVWGTAADNVYAVGGDSLLLRYDGKTWTHDSELRLDNVLTGVWGTSEHDIYVAGLSDGRLFHLGIEWREEYVVDDPPAGDPPAPELRDVWSLDEDRVVAVGSAGTILARQDDEWRRIADIPSNIEFRAVWLGRAGDDSHGVAVGDRCQIYHHTGDDLGTGWTPNANQSCPPIERCSPDSSTSSDLLGVWGRGPNDVFAVGTRGTILHYDGICWTRMTVDSDPMIDLRRLRGVWGDTSGPVFAVGNISDQDRDGGALLRLDGDIWTPLPLPEDIPVEVSTPALNSVWAGGGAVHVVGGFGLSLPGDGAGQWGDPQPIAINSRLGDVAGWTDDDLFATALI